MFFCFFFLLTAEWKLQVGKLITFGVEINARMKVSPWVFRVAQRNQKSEKNCSFRWVTISWVLVFTIIVDRYEFSKNQVSLILFYRWPFSFCRNSLDDAKNFTKCCNQRYIHLGKGLKRSLKQNYRRRYSKMKTFRCTLPLGVSYNLRTNCILMIQTARGGSC